MRNSRTCIAGQASRTEFRSPGAPLTGRFASFHIGVVVAMSIASLLSGCSVFMHGDPAGATLQVWNYCDKPVIVSILVGEDPRRDQSTFNSGAVELEPGGHREAIGGDGPGRFYVVVRDAVSEDEKYEVAFQVAKDVNNPGIVELRGVRCPAA